MKEIKQPSGGLQDNEPLRKGLEDDEERKRRERLQKGLKDQPQPQQGGLRDPEPTPAK